MLKKNLLPLLLTSLLIILAFALFNLQTTPTYQDEPTKLAQDDWHIYQSTSWLINRTTPTQQQILSSPFMRQKENIIYISQPEFQQLEPNKYTQLTSNHAEIYDNETYELFGQVQIQTQPDQTTLKTEYINYNKTTQLITSNQFVEITRDQQNTSGLGLTLDPKTDKLQLHSQVKTLYQQPKQTKE